MFSFLFSGLSEMLAGFYAITHSFGGAIILWTLVVMLILSPLTIKGTRSMLAMQKLSPELKKLQEAHKNDRQKLNEEVQKVYKDNNITPWGGCLPLLIQTPILFIFYRVISGLIHKTDGQISPRYISHGSELYKDIVGTPAGQHLHSFGINLATSAKSVSGGLAHAWPFYLIVILMVVIQYYQQHQMTSRAPAADTPQAQQMRQMQKIFPLFFGFISFNIPAAVVFYWIVSSLFRVAQQTLMYRFDPQLQETVASATKETEALIKRDKTSGRAQKAPSRPTNNNSNKKKRKGR